MPDPEPMAADAPLPAGALEHLEPHEAGTDQDPSPHNGRPYLRVFGPDTGVFEFTLPDDTIIVGRSDHADIRLPHHTVSRIHATLAVRDGEFVIEDAESNYGVTVNTRRVERHVLRHGDSIQISLYVLQFRTHPAPPGAAAAAARAKFLMRNDFCLLPSAMRLRLRTLEVRAREIFHSGDTLKIGHGGLLIPTASDLGAVVCVELELRWPTEQTKRYLGEILGAVEEGGLAWQCVKLHTVPRETHEAVIEAGQPGPWVEVTAT